MAFTKTEIKSSLEKHNIRLSKFAGQCFLIDKNILKKIIESAELSKNDVVLEVGAGMGNLTIELAKKVKRVAAVEKDKKIIKILEQNVKSFKNVKIIEGDILKITSKNCKLQIPPPKAGSPLTENHKQILNSKFQIPKHYKVVANIPYYLTSRLIRKFLELKNPPQKMILMVQKEVAQRIVAKKKLNLLAISVQFYALPEIVSYVSKNCFFPKPKVDSAILQITLLTGADKKQISADLFFKIARAGFSHPRKKLLRNLEKELKLNKELIKKVFLENKIDFNARAEDLSAENWLLLAKRFKSVVK